MSAVRTRLVAIHRWLGLLAALRLFLLGFTLRRGATGYRRMFDPAIPESGAHGARRCKAARDAPEEVET
jgi:uncharacterized iron-regulated membrane protein